MIHLRQAAVTAESEQLDMAKDKEQLPSPDDVETLDDIFFPEEGHQARIETLQEAILEVEDKIRDMALELAEMETLTPETTSRIQSLIFGLKSLNNEVKRLKLLYGGG